MQNQWPASHWPQQTPSFPQPVQRTEFSVRTITKTHDQSRLLRDRNMEQKYKQHLEGSIYVLCHYHFPDA